MDEPGRKTYLLVDGENIDATLGGSILGRRPQPEERPRWDRLLDFCRDRWGQPVQGLFFLAANAELPMAFVQALLAMGWRPVPLSGGANQKIVDIAIQRTIEAIGARDGDVMLATHDGDFLPQLEALCTQGRRVGVVGFPEFRNRGFLALADRGLEFYDLESDVLAFNVALPRIRIIPIDEFDPLDFL
jgi:putative heme uptake system protein